MPSISRPAARTTSGDVDLQQQHEQDVSAPDYLPSPDDPGRARRLAWAELFKRV